MNRRTSIVAFGLATVLGAFAVSPVAALPVWLRVIVGVPFVLWAPGAALLLAFDPRGRLGSLEWLALSLSTSIVAAMLAGMLLAASVGLTAEHAILVLAAGTLALLALAWARPVSSDADARRAGVLALTACAVVGCALVVLAISIPHPVTSGAGTVQLWGLPDTSGGVRVGVANVDATPRRYRLVVAQSGATITQQDVDLPPGTQRMFEVKESAMWTKSAPITAEVTDVGGSLPARTISVWPNR